MRFWLRWAIVTLPVVLWLYLWMQSYWTVYQVTRNGYHNEFSASIYRGECAFDVIRDDQWKLTGGTWFHAQFAAPKLDDDRLEQPGFLGFSYGGTQGPSPASLATLIEIPAWFVALLLGSLPLWLYRRQRKRRKTGFPIEPSTAKLS